MSVKYTEIASFENYGRCVKISNGTVSAIVTADLGPRILFYGYEGGENVLHLDLDRDTQWGGKAFDEYYFEGARSYLYGGHRIWVTPESAPETYYPDNTPVDIEYTDKGAIFTAPAQMKNDIQISLEIEMAPEGTDMVVYNRVRNVGKAAKEFAVWTVSVMCRGGVEIIPQNTNDTGYLHNRVLTMWAYTNPNDYRFYNGKNYITVKQDPGAATAFKIGYNNRAGTAIYAAKETVFIKRRAVDHDNLIYPDGGSSFETYTGAGCLELEMLDDVRNVQPGEQSELKEFWSLAQHDGAPDPRSDNEIDTFYKEYVK